MNNGFIISSIFYCVFVFFGVSSIYSQPDNPTSPEETLEKCIDLYMIPESDANTLRNDLKLLLNEDFRFRYDELSTYRKYKINADIHFKLFSYPLGASYTPLQIQMANSSLLFSLRKYFHLPIISIIQEDILDSQYNELTNSVLDLLGEYINELNAPNYKNKIRYELLKHYYYQKNDDSSFFFKKPLENTVFLERVNETKSTLENDINFLLQLDIADSGFNQLIKFNKFKNKSIHGLLWSKLLQNIKQPFINNVQQFIATHYPEGVDEKLGLSDEEYLSLNQIIQKGLQESNELHQKKFQEKVKQLNSSNSEMRQLDSDEIERIRYENYNRAIEPINDYLDRHAGIDTLNAKFSPQSDLIDKIKTTSTVPTTKPTHESTIKPTITPTVQPTDSGESVQDESTVLLVLIIAGIIVGILAVAYLLRRVS